MMRKFINIITEGVTPVVQEDVAGRMIAPDVGAIIEVDDPNQWSDKGGLTKGKSRYRVNSWLKAAPEPKYDLDQDFDRWHDDVMAGKTDFFNDILDSGARQVGPDKKRLQWCKREEAEYLSCSGVGGAIIRIEDAKVVGRVPWPENQIEELRSSALRKVGQLVG